MIKILIVDKQRSIRNILTEKLKFEGYSAEAVEELQEACKACEEHENFPYRVVIGDQGMFADYLAKPESLPNNTSIVVMSDSASVDDAVDAMKSGAFDFVTKPLDMNYILAMLRQIYSESEADTSTDLKPEVAPLAKVSNKSSLKVEEIIGGSIQINHVKNLIDKVATSDARVLITGPNGSGKELVARWLHEKSNRCGAPFVEVNCAAIPSELIESELFGHEKGAFTSAIKQRKGKFEQANGGTLFLDEIGDMSLSAQAKVLRVLQENRLSRVGSDKDLTVDVRIVAATNKNLRAEMDQGLFREDLYHRLSVIVIPVPPLADRIDDLPMLVEHFLGRISAEYGIVPKQVDKAAVECLKGMDWTGNIRELRNVIERLIILSDNNLITSADVRTYATHI